MCAICARSFNSTLNVLTVLDPTGELELLFRVPLSMSEEDESDSWIHAEAAGISDSPDIKKVLWCLWERTANSKKLQ